MSLLLFYKRLNIHIQSKPIVFLNTKNRSNLLWTTSSVVSSRCKMTASTELAEAPSSPPKPKPKKLHGRKFYESIGSPRRIVAPMVDASDLAWRLLSRKFSADLAYSPMLHARLFSESEPYRNKNILAPSTPSVDTYDGDTRTDRPVFIQFCANDPDTLFSAAKHIQDQCDAVDLNLGCPQGIARKGNYGSFLQEDPQLIFRLINKLHSDLDIPVTAKIRILETREKTLEYANMVLRAGASILTVHGRRREQKGHNTGLADWSMIRYLRENLPSDTVLFANGNILYNTDIEACLEATGADGVMSAESNLYNPAIFVPATASFDQRFPRVDHICREYFKLLCSVVFGSGKPYGILKGKENISAVAFKQHMFRLLHAAFQRKENHYIREMLAKSTMKDFTTYENVVSEIEKAVATYVVENPENEDEWDEILSSGGGIGEDMKKLDIPWYRCQPHIRASPQEAIEKGAIKMPKKQVVAQQRKKEKEQEEKGEAAAKDVPADQDEPERKRIKLDDTIEKPMETEPVGEQLDIAEEDDRERAAG